MKREDIKSLEDALQYIDEIENEDKQFQMQIDGLSEKLKDAEASRDDFEKQVGDLKQKYYDLWQSAPREGAEPQVKEEPSKSLDELLME